MQSLRRQLVDIVIILTVKLAGAIATRRLPSQPSGLDARKKETGKASSCNLEAEIYEHLKIKVRA